MISWYMAAQNVVTGRAQHETRFPLNKVVRADGKFPYRPDIVCPRPERRYEAQIGLKVMEEQAVRTAALPDNEAKWALEALASRVEAHFAHLRGTLSVANCALCRTSRVGRAVINMALTVTSTHAAAPYPTHSPVPRATVRASGCHSDRLIENTTQCTRKPRQWGDMRSMMVCRDEFPITTARQPLLPDRDAITTNAWSEAYSLSLRSSLEGGEEERILWPRGVCGYEYGGIGYGIHFNPVPSSWDFLD